MNNAYIYLVLIAIGYIFAEVCFHLIIDLDKNEENSIKHRLLSAFHFFGLFLFAAGLFVTYFIGKNQVGKRKV